MRLNHGLHLAYCTNVHRGETWAETFDALKKNTLKVRDRVCPGRLYAIGLRLSNQAAHELKEPATLLQFQHWLEQNRCYVFTINGFPYGQFHGKRVKEQVYSPDWTTPERLSYTNLLIDLLVQLLPAGIEGSVSTVPCGFKLSVTKSEEWDAIRKNLWRCVEHVARVASQTGKKLHVGLEPEPMCLLETSSEVVHLFERLRAEHPNDSRLAEYLGVNYDTCHFAVEFEEPEDSIAALQNHGIKLSKIHLSSALKLTDSAAARAALAAFDDGIYLHQVIVSRPDGKRTVYLDIDDAMACEPPTFDQAEAVAAEWRVHFHVPLHSPPTALFGNTSEHILGILDLLQNNPSLCSHLEMETYTWEVLPAEFKTWNVVDQLVAEYEWTLGRMSERGLWNNGES